MAEEPLQRVEYFLAPRVSEVQQAIPAILSQARNWGLADERAQFDLHMALEEALANAVLHGALRIGPEYRQRGVRELLSEADARASRPPYVDHRVQVRLELLPCAVRVTIDDGGPGFDRSRIASEAPPDAIGGRGLMLIRSCVDWFQHNDAGNQITMLKHFAASQQEGEQPSAGFEA